jgi:hypothetical protein
LHDAQLVIARAYGFESWPKLRAFVEGATVRRLVDAVRAGAMDEVRATLKVRRERLDFRICLFNSGAGLQPAEHDQPVIADLGALHLAHHRHERECDVPRYAELGAL